MVSLCKGELVEKAEGEEWRVEEGEKEEEEEEEKMLS